MFNPKNWRPSQTVALICAALCGVSLLAFERQVQPAGEADEKMARATCSGCHAFPPPEILPRDRWRDEFVRMTFIRENRLPPIGAPETVYKSCNCRQTSPRSCPTT